MEEEINDTDIIIVTEAGLRQLFMEAAKDNPQIRDVNALVSETFELCKKKYRVNDEVDEATDH